MTLGLAKSTWKRVAFGDVVKNVNDTFKDPAPAGVDRVIAMDHLDPGELKVGRWGDLADGTTFTRRVRPGQTLFGKRRTYQRKVAYAEFDAVCSGDILVFEADAERLRPDFLPFLVQSNGFYDHALGTSAGSLSPRTNWRDLSGYEFDLPQLDEQERIAKLLWSVERSRISARRIVRRVEAAEAAWLDSVYSDVKHEHIAISALMKDATVALLTGPFGSTLSSRDYVAMGVPVIHPSFIVEGRITVDDKSMVSGDTAKRLSRWKVRVGDIIFMRKRDVTRSAVVTPAEEGWILGSDCILVRVDPAAYDPDFVRAMLRSPEARTELLARAPGTAMPGINEGSLADLRLPAIDISRQRRILVQYAKVRDAYAALVNVVAATDLIRGAVSACVFGAAG